MIRTVMTNYSLTQRPKPENWATGVFPTLLSQGNQGIFIVCRKEDKADEHNVKCDVSPRGNKKLNMLQIKQKEGKANEILLPKPSVACELLEPCGNGVTSFFSLFLSSVLKYMDYGERLNRKPNLKEMMLTPTMKVVRSAGSNELKDLGIPNTLPGLFYCN